MLNKRESESGTLPTVDLKKLQGVYTISRLLANVALPTWVDGKGFVNISRDDDEVTVICLRERVPSDVECYGVWTCLQLVGPFAFGQTAVVLSVIRPASESGIGIVVVSTFTRDYLLVQNADAENAIRLLKQAGHTVL